MSLQGQKIIVEGTSVFFCHIKTIQLCYEQFSSEWKHTISQYMDKNSGTVSTRQCNALLRYCFAFALFMQKQNILSIKTVTYGHLEDFIEYTACVSGKKRSQCLSVVRQFLEFWAGEGLCTQGFQIYIRFYLQNRPFLTPAMDEDAKYKISLWAKENPSFPAEGLLNRIPSFEQALDEQGYSYVSRRHAVRTLRVLYLFLDMNGLVYHKEISCIWFEYGKNIFQSGWKIARKSLRMFDEYVGNGAISLHHDNYSVTKRDQIPQWCVPWVASFLEVKSKENMAKDTIDNYLFSIARLCLFMERKGLDSFMELTPALLKEFNIYDKHGSSAGKNSCNLRIRKFLIYLAEKDAVTNRCLYESLPNVAASKERIVTTLSDKELSEIRSSVKEAASPLELRDKAMLLLGLRMGLRASDIVNLKLSDINWKDTSIRYMQQKTKSELLLPMPVEVGNAIFNYLTMGRPEAESSYIFLRSVAPYTKVGKSVCRDALCRALPEHSSPGPGFHVTRRTFSTAMLNRGAKPQMIADALGHTGTDNLKKYLALDSERMKDCPLSLKDLGISMEGWTGNHA